MEDLASRMMLFARVLEEGSFSAAARSLGRTPSSVSRQMAALEDELGLTLFRRTTRKLELTEAGDLYADYARRVRAEVEDAAKAVGGLGRAPTGHLRVSAPVGLALAHLNPILPGFFARYPKIDLGLHLSDAVVDLVEERFDVAIRFGRLPTSELRQRQLAMAHSAVCASPEYVARHGEPRAPSDLTQHHCLSFRTLPGSSTWRFRRGGDAVEVKVRGALNANSGLGLSAAAEAGLGIVLLPSWHVLPGLRSGKLLRLLRNYEIDPPAAPVSAVYLHGKHIAPKVRAFIDYVAEQFASQDWGAPRPKSPKSPKRP